MPIYRMNRDEATRWRLNRNWLVRSDGTRIRTLTKEETNRYEQLRQSDVPPVIRVDGEPCDIIPERVLLERSWLQQHGEVIVKRVNGVTLKHVKDPNRLKPKYTSELIDTPHPDNCACKDQGTPHPGHHHPLCQYNARAPLDHRALPEAYSSLPEPVNLDLPTETPEPEIAPLANPDGIAPQYDTRVGKRPQYQEGVPHPKNCACLDWGAPPNPEKGKQHNSVCQWYSSWKNLHPSETTYYLINEETGNVLRKANDIEIQSGALAGGTLTINKTQYRVALLDGKEPTLEDLPSHKPASNLRLGSEDKEEPEENEGPDTDPGEPDYSSLPPGHYLVEDRSGKVLRVAMPEEVEEANNDIAGTVVLDGVDYRVIDTRSDADVTDTMPPPDSPAELTADS